MQIKKLFVEVLMHLSIWRRALRWERALLSGLKAFALLALIKMKMGIRDLDVQGEMQTTRTDEGRLLLLQCVLLHSSVVFSSEHVLLSLPGAVTKNLSPSFSVV
jgi:hypothetical protein